MTLEETYDAMLLDLDGTVWEGSKAVPHAVEAIKASPLPAVYVTNNASRPPEEVVRKLALIDLEAKPVDVVTAAMVAADLAAELLPAGAKVLVVGAPSFRELVAQAGLVPVSSADDEPAAVLQGHYTETGWHELSEAAFSIQRGAIYIASNRDTSLPGDRGLAVGNGAMVTAVEACTGVTARSAGKPEPAAFHVAARRKGATRPLAVGDRLDTDIRGANNAGIPTMHVMTGVSRHWEVLRAPADDRPTYLAEDFRSLTREAAELLPGEQGGFRATWVDDATIALEGPEQAGDPMAAFRTVAARAWERPESFRGEVRALNATASAAMAQWSNV